MEIVLYTIADITPYPETAVRPSFAARMGEVLAAVVTDERDPPALAAVARKELVDAARPRRWEHVAALPLTSAGKVDRAALAQRLYG